MDTLPETETRETRVRPTGDSVGRYALRQHVGAGGMGDVYVAFDPQLEREVALKLLRVSRAGDPVETERLLREANAMAKVSHPNVVAVFDAGMDGDHPWVAMELVRGATLREWLAAEHTWLEKLHVLCQVARGLEAAHAAGLVHRDVKPENVLIGSDGRVAVADFGIAQRGRGPGAAAPAPGGFSGALPSTPSGLATPARLAVRALASNGAEPRMEIAGTPGYMAPEQRLGRETDARSDQYAFAVTAWEVLAGRLPHDGARPSRVAPAAVWRALERALREDPGARWPSMSELRQRLEAALPASRLGRPLGVALALSAAAALAFALKPAAVDPCEGAAQRLAGVWDSAEQQRLAAAFTATRLTYAGDAWLAAQRSVDAWARAWSDQSRDACRATRVEGRQSEQLLDLRMQCLERARTVLAALTAQWKRDLSPEAVQAAANAGGKLPSLSACADLRALAERAPLPAVPAVQQQIALARAKVDEAKAALLADRRAEAKAAAVAAREPADATKWDPVRAEAALAEGKALADLSDTAAEGRLLEAARLGSAARDDRLVAEALIELVHHLAEDKQNAARALLVAELADGALLRSGDDPLLRVHLWRYRGAAYLSQGSYPEAGAAFTKAYELAKQKLGEHDWEATANVGELGRVAEAQGQWAEARRLGDQVVAAGLERFGPHSPTVASLLNNLAMAVDRGGDPEAAIEYHRRALAIKEEALGPENASTATTLNNLAIIFLKLDRREEGQAMLERALAIREKALGPEHAYVATTLGNLANAVRGGGDYARALELLDRSLAIKTKAYGPVHANVANTLAELGMTHLAAGRPAQALEWFQKCLEVRIKALGPVHPQTLHASNLVATAQIALSRCGEAGPVLEKNVATLKEIEGGKTSPHAEALAASADCLLARGDAAKAEERLNAALELRTAMHGDSLDLGLVHWGLARARWALGRKAEALELAHRAEKELAVDATTAPQLAAVRAWLRSRG